MFDKSMNSVKKFSSTSFALHMDSAKSCMRRKCTKYSCLPTTHSQSSERCHTTNTDCCVSTHGHTL